MPKDILLDVEARSKLVKGIDIVANAVKTSLGPKGRNVALGKKYSGPTVTHDGVTVAKDIDLEDPFEDMGARVLGTQPPQNGSRFAVIEFPPGEPTNMHRTESIDYVICLCGKIDMDMDSSTVTMNAGDVMVQRGTNHAWVNRYELPARVAFVLLDAAPIGIGDPVAHGTNAGEPRGG